MNEEQVRALFLLAGFEWSLTKALEYLSAVRYELQRLSQLPPESEVKRS